MGGSDDSNASSFPKTPPEGLQAISSLIILENQPVSTVVGTSMPPIRMSMRPLPFSLVSGMRMHIFISITTGLFELQ